MGIGGQLMWTVLAKEIFEKYKKKVMFICNNRIFEDPIWLNNQHISQNENNKIRITGYNFSKSIKLAIVNNIILINLSSYDTTTEVKNSNIHTIINRCNHYNFNPKLLYPILNYTKEEEFKINTLLKELPNKFLCIEPHAKTSWTHNKTFPLNKWQNIVNKLVEQNITVVQVSIPNKKLLNNVIDFRSKLSSFRECACLLKYCNLFISTEGGLMHASAANNNNTFIIFSPMFNPKKTLYNNIDYIWIHNKNHNCCNKIQKCNECLQQMNDFDEYSIIDKIIKLYNK
tara:strand:- start:5906 stop:6763 length:858 start_codon:yes stop_codon:yes gene_type:complete